MYVATFEAGESLKIHYKCLRLQGCPCAVGFQTVFCRAGQLQSACWLSCFQLRACRWTGHWLCDCRWSCLWATCPPKLWLVLWKSFEPLLENIQVDCMLQVLRGAPLMNELSTYKNLQVQLLKEIIKLKGLMMLLGHAANCFNSRLSRLWHHLELVDLQSYREKNWQSPASKVCQLEASQLCKDSCTLGASASLVWVRVLTRSAGEAVRDNGLLSKPMSAEQELTVQLASAVCKLSQQTSSMLKNVINSAGPKCFTALLLSCDTLQDLSDSQTLQQVVKANVSILQITTSFVL